MSVYQLDKEQFKTRREKILIFPLITPVEQYGTCTAVLGSYFTVIQVGDLRPYFQRNTTRIRSIYGVNTAKIRREYGCKSPTWITAKYSPKTVVYVQIRRRNDCLRLGYVHLRSTVSYHQGNSNTFYIIFVVTKHPFFKR